MPQLVDCPECACLIDADERACPFCGATPRRVAMTSLLGLGFMLGLTTASCGDKNDTTQGATTTSTSTDGTTSTTEGVSTVVDPTEDVASTSAYAGPTTSTFDSDESVGSAYAGPASTDDSFPDTDSSSTDSSSGTSTDTSTDSSTSSTSTDSSTTVEGTTEIGQSTAYAGPTSMTDTDTTDPFVPEDGQ